MNGKEYVELALKTCSEEFHRQLVRPCLLHASIGMVTEVGEFADAIKRALFYGKPLDRANLIEELGDVMWYVAIACNELEVGLDDVCKANIEKLKKRLPDRFCQEKALERNLESERDAIEGSLK